MIKKTIAISLSLFIFISYATGTVNAYTDINQNSIYQNAVNYVESNKIMDGICDTKFLGDKNTTRGELLVMLMRAYQIEPVDYGDGNFDDAYGIYAPYMAAAKHINLTDGVGDNKFMPDKNITRQEMFVFIYRALIKMGKLLKSKADCKMLSDYEDADKVSDWAYDATKTLVESGTIVGDGTNIYPYSMCTRYQVAQTLYNLTSKINYSEEYPYPTPRGEPGKYTRSNFFDLVSDDIQEYQIHQPAKKVPGVKYPVLIHLHGSGEGGDTRRYPERTLTGSILIDDLISKINRSPDEYECYMVLPIDYSTYKIKLIVDRLINEEDADPDRIYITGASNGGQTSCNFMFSYPDVPAAVVPICGCVTGPYEIDKILNIPIRIYHSADDNVISVETSRGLYHALVDAGAKNVQYFECNGYKHRCWEYAHRTDMLDWMFQQNRKNQ